MVFDFIKKNLIEELEIDESKITKNAKLADDLGMDSIDAVELIMKLEDEYDIRIDENADKQIVTINDLVSYVEELIKKKNK